MQHLKQWLLLAAVLTTAMVGTISSAQAALTTVGNPANPTTLQSEIISAYNAGAIGVTVNPGKYVLPQISGVNLMLTGFTRAFEIDAYNVELVLQCTNDGVRLVNCSNLTFKGATLDRGAPYGNQGMITAFGVDPNNAGVYYEVQGDAGYPSTGWTYNIVLAENSHLPKPGTKDLGWVGSVEQLGNNKVRIHSTHLKSWNGWSIQVGDYLACHAEEAPLLEVSGSSNCMIQDVTFLQSPSWCAIREDACTGNHYFYDTITYGPPPAGATNPPLLSTGSGFQGVGDYVGPDVEGCLFEGTGDDGFDLRGPLVTVTACSGNTVTVAATSNWNVNDPIRLSDDHGGYQDATVTAINGTVLTLNQTVTVQAGTGVLTRASNPNRNCGGYKIINTTVQNNRARGMLLRGDNGLVQGCTLQNNSIASIFVGLEAGYAFSEGDYSHNVLIQNNTISNSAYAGNAGIVIGGCGSLGNQNIEIRNNLFTGVWGENIDANGVTGLTLNWNTFANTYQSNLTAKTGSVIGLSQAANVTLNANAVTASGPYQTGLVAVGTGVTNLVNNNTAGIATGVLSSGLYKLTHRGTSECLNVTSNGTTDGTNVQQFGDNGNDAQRWIAVDLLNGYFNLIHKTTNKALAVSGASLANGDGGQTNGNVVQWTNNGNLEQQWAIADQGNGSVKLTNRNSGKYLDVFGNGTADGTNVDQYTDSGSDAQRWILNLISPLPSINLVQNPSFENNGFTFTPGYWSISTAVGSNAAYAQNRGVTSDGDYQLVNWSVNPYTVDTSQLVKGLTNGAYYAATAWVCQGGGVNAAYFYANGYDTAGSQLSASIPGTGNWFKITLPNILVANGQCRIGLHSRDTVGGHVVVMDSVAFFKQ